MSRDKCAECGGRTEWDENVGSAICIECGTLADPTQSVLTNHLDFPSNGTSGPWTTNTTLSLKGRKGWTLAGQSQEASLTRNRVSLHRQFLRYSRSLRYTLRLLSMSSSKLWPSESQPAVQQSVRRRCSTRECREASFAGVASPREWLVRPLR